VAFYDGATLIVTEVISKTILLPMLAYGVCLGVAEIAESTNLKGCPYTFVYKVYVNAILRGNPEHIAVCMIKTLKPWILIGQTMLN
jgi:hypothetical protein